MEHYNKKKHALDFLFRHPRDIVALVVKTVYNGESVKRDSLDNEKWSVVRIEIDNEFDKNFPMIDHAHVHVHVIDIFKNYCTFPIMICCAFDRLELICKVWMKREVSKCLCAVLCTLTQERVCAMISAVHQELTSVMNEAEFPDAKKSVDFVEVMKNREKLPKEMKTFVKLMQVVKDSENEI